MFALLIVAAVAVAATVQPPGVEDMRGWLSRAGPAAWAGIVLGLALALLTPAPRSVLSVLVGAVAGFTGGLVVVVLAGVLGGLAGYALSRWLGRAALLRLVGDRLARIEQRLARRAFLAVLIARISPVPFMVVSYAAGLSNVRLGPYLLGTAMGVLPGSVLYVGIGTSLSALIGWAPRWPAAAVALFAVVALSLSGAVWWWRRRPPPVADSPPVPSVGADS